MSRRINDDPLAVTSAGTVLVNVAHFDGSRRVEALIGAGTKQPGPMFVGVELSGAEVRRVLEQIGHGHREAAAFVVGRRIKGAKLVRR